MSALNGPGAGEPVNGQTLASIGQGPQGAPGPPGPPGPGSGPYLAESLVNDARDGDGGPVNLGPGEVVRIFGDGKVYQAIAIDAGHIAGTVGVALAPILFGATGSVVTAGQAQIRLETGLTPVAGDRLWVSPTAYGRATNVEPGAFRLMVGIVKDASGYAPLSPASTVLADVLVNHSPAQFTDHVEIGASSAAASGAVAIGLPANAPGAVSIALGQGAVASGSLAFAAGQGASATADHAVALGAPVLASAPQAIAIGGSAQATVDNAVAVGFRAIAQAISSVAIGDNAHAITGADTSVALGALAQTQDVNAIAIGQSATALGPDGIAIGDSALTQAVTDAIAIGHGVQTTAARTTRIASPDTFVQLDAGGASIGDVGTTPNLGASGRALTVSAGTSGDHVARLEVQGSRTSDAVVSILDFFNQAFRLMRLAVNRAGDPSNGTAVLSTGNVAGGLHDVMAWGTDQTVFVGVVGDQTGGGVVGPGNLQLFGSTVSSGMAAGRTVATAIQDAPLFAFLGYNSSTVVAAFEIASDGAANSGNLIFKNRGNGGGLSEKLRMDTQVRLADGINLESGTGVGSMIAGTALQKLGFFGQAPTARPAAVADPAGGVIIDVECRAQLTLLLARMRQLGLIAP